MKQRSLLVTPQYASTWLVTLRKSIQAQDAGRKSGLLMHDLNGATPTRGTLAELANKIGLWFKAHPDAHVEGMDEEPLNR